MQFEIKKHVYVVLPTEAADKAYGKIRGVFDSESDAKAYAKKHSAGSRVTLTELITSQMEGMVCHHELATFVHEGSIACKKCNEKFLVKAA